MNGYKMELSMGGFLVISGCPRSGTSVCTDIHRQSYGEDRFLGAKFPQKTRQDVIEEQIENEENPNIKQIRVYAQKKFHTNAPEEDYKDLNPLGFWEHHFTTGGIYFLPRFKDELKEVLNEFKIIKVVSQALSRTNPIYVNRIVHMVRHPRAVAKSQEKLSRGGEDKEIWDSLKEHSMDTVHTPEMFINSSMIAMNFFKNNPNIPVKIIQYEDLLKDPKSVIKSIHKFNGLDGDLKAAASIVTKKLDRSKHEDVENVLWGDAEYVYNVLLELQILFDAGKPVDKLIDKTNKYMSDPKREINKKNEKWFCFRAKRQVTAYECERCMLDTNFRSHYKDYSITQIQENVNHWADEPCVFECGRDVERKTYIDVEDSIYMNFWRRDKPLDLEKLRE